MDGEITPFQAFKLAISRANGQSGLARMVGCTPGNISQLVKKGAPLPGRFALKAEEGTGVSRHLLAPDFYPLDAVIPGAPLHDGVVAEGAPIVACDRSAILHPEASHG